MGEVKIELLCLVGLEVDDDVLGFVGSSWDVVVGGDCRVGCSLAI